MERRTKVALLLGGLGAGALIAAGTGVAVATGEEAETPITGAAYDRAAAAALAHTGGGRVTDTEVGDEESYYEVEVTLPDGSQTDVQLDDQFRVVGSEVDEGDTPADP